METRHRIESLSELLRQSEVGALIVTNLLNIRYLTGFSGSAGTLIIGPDGNTQGYRGILCTDGRYNEQATRQLEDADAQIELFIGSPGSQMEKAALFIASSTTIAIEAESTSMAVFESWNHQLQTTPIASPIKVESLRQFKDEEEINLLRRAAHIADEALSQLAPRLLDHPSELEFAAELEFKMRMLGADGPSFETIVASGPNSAMPHARPTNRKIREGDTVVIDYGAIINGYHSDCSRTYFIGEIPSGKHSLVYDAVRDSQQKGFESIQDGVQASQIDITCRKSLEEAGFAQYFTHGTGHGVGLEIHELPWISKENTSELKPGNVLTVEPGVYLEREFGVRIEDTIALTRNGVETLTLVAKSPIIG